VDKMPGSRPSEGAHECEVSNVYTRPILFGLMEFLAVVKEPTPPALDDSSYVNTETGLSHLASLSFSPPY